MRFPELHYRWDLDLRSSPEALWLLVSDTNRFNRDTGVPAVSRVMDTGLVNARQRLRLSRYGVQIEWEEEPFEWVRPSRFGVRRRYSKGPVAEMRVQAELEPRAGSGSHLTYEIWARPRSVLGLAAIPVQIGILNERTFEETFRRYDSAAAEHAEASNQEEVSTPAPHVDQARLAQLHAALLRDGVPANVVTRLTTLVEEGDELAVARMRPYALADAWGLPRRAVLEACLVATRVGLLELRWDVLCPLCRGPKETFATLSAVGGRVHCDVCNIDATVNLDRFVEVTFRPGAAVRAVDVGEYCVGGPQVTPHIVMQQLLEAGETRSLVVSLEPGRYRLRTLGLPGAESLVAAPEGEPGVSLRASQEGWPEEEPQLGLAPTLTLENASAGEQLFILERTAWSDTAATAADVILLQHFRDLFSREALRPQQPISVGSLAILFTDLRDSTRLYRRIGDAPAFGVVMDHFDVLREAIAGRGGAVVKTIGDAVMGAFREPAGALEAILDAQERLQGEREDGVPIVLKAGIHYGPCIAVTLNDHLDYFGSSVNIASRLEGLSDGGDIIVSSQVYEDPGVRALLEDESRGLRAEPIEGTLKGLEEERVGIVRIFIS